MNLWIKLRQYFYYRNFEKYIEEQGAYEDLLILQGSDYEYCVTSMSVQQVGFYARKPPKVVAALIIDSTKMYDRSRDLSIQFLKNLQKQFAQEAIGFGVKGIEIPNEMNSTEDEEEFDTYHQILDEAASYCSEYLKDISAPKNQTDEDSAFALCSELIVYIVSFIHVLDCKVEIHQMSWNTYKASIENRMLAIKDDESPRSGLSSNGQAFASLASGYHMKMDGLEEEIRSSEDKSVKGRATIISNFLEREFDLEIFSVEEFQPLISRISGMASKEIVPAVIRAFE